MMMNYRVARKNMVEGQLATNGITNARLLQLFKALPREMFVPDSCQAQAYADEDFVLPNGAILVEPLVHARMVQALKPQPEEVALLIGDTTGYAAAVLCGFVSTVVALEGRPGTLDRAQKVWAEIGANNIAVIPGQDGRGSPEHAPFSLIVLHGAVTHVPEHMLDQLAPGGRLITVLRAPEAHCGRLTLISRDGENNFSVATLNDATTPYIDAFRPPQLFRFG